MKKDRIPEDLKQQVERELLSGEELLWVGQPAPLRFALRNHPELPLTWSRIVTGVMLTIAVLAFVYSGIANQPTAVWFATVLLMLTFTAAIVSRPLERYKLARGTVYAVTDRRALTHSPRGVRSHMPEDLKTIERVNHTKQMGDLIFGHKSQRRMIWMFLSIREVEPIGFFNVRYPEQLEALLMETFHKGEVFTSPSPRIPESTGNDEEVFSSVEEDSQQVLSI